MGHELGLDGQAGVFPLSDRFAEMGGIPVNDYGGEQVEPGHAVVLALAGAVADFAMAPDPERVLECVMSLALVQTGVGSVLHIGVEQLADDEERSFDPSDFAESDGQFVLARIGRELSQQLARRKGATSQGGSNPQHVSISPLSVHPDRRGAVRKRIVQRTVQSVASNPAKPAPAASHMNGTETIAQAGPYPYTSPMTATLIGYARCSTDRQDLAAQRQAILELGVAEDRIYTDHGLTGATRARPGLDQALAAVRQGDTLVVPKLDRLARSVPDARAIADRLRERGVKLALGRALYDPGDPMGKMFFNILATFAEFEADLIRMRTREGMAIARARGKLRGKQPKLSDRQQRELCRMHATGEYSISDLAELFSVSRPTVYRTLNRRLSP